MLGRELSSRCLTLKKTGKPSFKDASLLVKANQKLLLSHDRVRDECQPLEPRVRTEVGLQWS